MKSVLVNVGEVLLVPVEDLESVSRMRWWGQPAFSVPSPAVDACVRRGWNRYHELTHPVAIHATALSRYRITIRSVKTSIRRFLFRFTPIRSFLRT